MKETAWLAALLSPRTVAPHPNFASDEKVTGPGLLALVIQGRAVELKGFRERSSVRLERQEESILGACERMFSGFEEMRASAEGLAQLARDPATSAGISTAAALLASIGLAELDAGQDAVALLQEMLDGSVGSRPEFGLLGGAIAQQAAMRSWELGLHHDDLTAAARALLKKAEPKAQSRYAVSNGSRWSAATTNRHIRTALIRANDDLVDAGKFFPTASELKMWLRRPQSELISAVTSMQSESLAALTDEMFASLSRSDAVTLRREDPIDAPVWRALTFFECLGYARQARSYRGRLGKLRMVRGEGANAGASGALRLIRHSGIRKDLVVALSHYRTQGPLVALRSEVRHVVEWRLSPPLLRDVEFAVLEVGSQVLSRAEASEALESVLAAMNSPELHARQGQIKSLQLENALKASSALARASGREESYSIRLLENMVEAGPIDDQILATAYARSLSSLDWHEFDSPTLERWRRWTESDLPAAGWADVLEVVWPLVRPPENSEARPAGIADAAVTLGTVAHELNAVMEGSPAPLWLRDAGNELLGAALRGAVEDAQRGRVSLLGVDLADLAAGCAIFVGSADLWRPLADFLLSPVLPDSQKSAAFDRLAANAAVVDPYFREIMSRESANLLESGSVTSPFERAPAERPAAAVRFLVALNVLPELVVVRETTRLACGDVRDRLDATRLMGVLSSTRPSLPKWLVSLVIQLSVDGDASVRAGTAYTLTKCLSAARFAPDLVLERLLALLSEDGVLVPLLVLRELKLDTTPLVVQLEDKIREMSLHHLAASVRRLARTVLDQGESKGF